MTAAKKIPGWEMDYSRSEMNSLVKWRKEKVWELRSCGLTIDEIVESLKPKQGIKISHATVTGTSRQRRRKLKLNSKTTLRGSFQYSIVSV